MTSERAVEPGEAEALPVMELTPNSRRDALVNWFADLNDGMRSISSGRFAAGEPERNADAVLALLAATPAPREDGWEELRRLAEAVGTDDELPTPMSGWTATEDDDGYWSVNAVGDGKRTPVHCHITFGPQEAAHRYIAAVSPDVVLRLLAVARGEPGLTADHPWAIAHEGIAGIIAARGEPGPTGALEAMRQVHARHDLGHTIGAWPNACALCEAHRAVAALATPTTPEPDPERRVVASGSSVVPDGEVRRLRRIETAARELNKFATWSALNRPETQALLDALATPEPDQ